MSIELAFSYSHVLKKKIKLEDNIKLTYLLTTFWVIRNESKPRF